MNLLIIYMILFVLLILILLWFRVSKSNIKIPLKKGAILIRYSESKNPFKSNVKDVVLVKDIRNGYCQYTNLYISGMIGINSDSISNLIDRGYVLFDPEKITNEYSLEEVKKILVKNNLI